MTPRPADSPRAASSGSTPPRLPAGVVIDLDDTLMDTAGAEAEMLVGLCAAVRAELPDADEESLCLRFRDGRDDFYGRVLTGEWDIPTYRRAHLDAVCEPWGAPSEQLHVAALALRDEQVERSRFAAHAVELLRELRSAGCARRCSPTGRPPCSGARSTCSASRTSSTRSGSRASWAWPSRVPPRSPPPWSSSTARRPMR